MRTVRVLSVNYSQPGPPFSKILETFWRRNQRLPEVIDGKDVGGAGYGDRTRLAGLGSQSITTMLSPRLMPEIQISEFRFQISQTLTECCSFLQTSSAICNLQSEICNLQSAISLS